MKKNKDVAGLDEEGFASAQPAPSGAVATRPEGGALMAQGTGRGMEDVDNEDLIIPRAKLLQPLSPELQEYPELRAGMIINSLTKEVLPSEFSPVFYFKSFIRFNPRDKKMPGFDSNFEPGALMWQTRDVNDPRVAEQCTFGPNGEHPLALTTLNFFSLPIPNSGMPVIISFSKTSYKAGKNLLSLAKLRGGDLFSRKYKLSVKQETNDKGTYYVLVVNPAGDCDQDMYKTGEQYFQQFGLKREALKTAPIDDAEVV